MTLDPRELAGFVDWGGPTWLRQVAAGLEWLGPVTDLRVLDIGTRNGGMATYFAVRGALVTAIDVSDETFAVARARSRDHGVADRVDFRTYSGRAEDLPVGFDIVFAKSTLVLMGDVAVLGHELASSLEPGGRLLAVENARGPLAMRVLRAAVRRSWRPYGANYFTRDTVRAVTSGLDVELERWTTVPPTVVIGARRTS
jgi:SAM-dependent methyltransferase